MKSAISVSDSHLLDDSRARNYFYRVWDVLGVSNGKKLKAKLESELTPQLPKPVGRRKRLRALAEKRGLEHKGRKMGRKVLRRPKARTTIGIPQLFAHRHFYDQRFEKPVDAKIPYFVERISTNGLQAHVTLVSLVPKATNEQFNKAAQTPLPEGTRRTAENHYDGVKGTLDLDVHTQGIFKKSKVHDGNMLDVVGIGLDPGRIEVFATVRTEVKGVDGEKAFCQPSISKSQTMFGAEQCERNSLRNRMERHEKERRERNVAYGEAIKALNEKSMREPGKSAEYIAEWYNRLNVLRRELICFPRRQRNFSRFRARQRLLSHMARTVVYGLEQKKFWKEKRTQLTVWKRWKMSSASKRGKISTALFKAHLKNLRTKFQSEKAKKRVVLFGDAKFGHGKPCPVPRKLLVREISFLCPVLIVDEFRTSKTCFRCNSQAIDDHGCKTKTQAVYERQLHDHHIQPRCGSKCELREMWRVGTAWEATTGQLGEKE